MNTRQINFICFVFVFCSSFLPSFSQEAQFSSGFFSGEGCNFASSRNVWAIQTNPALLANIQQTEVGAAYSTNFYMTNTLCSRINACTQLKQNVIGTSVVYFGNSHFRDSYFDFCIARKLNTHNALGIKLDIQQVFQDEYGHSYHILPEFAYYGENGKLSYGMHIINPLHLFKSNNQTSVFKACCNYQASQDFSLGCSFNQSTSMNIAVNATYNVKNIISCSLTYCTGNVPFALNFQMPIGNFICDYETEIHYYLGFSHTISFIYIL